MKTQKKKPNAILILLFFVQFLINFIEEFNLLHHPIFRQRLKNTLKTFTAALEEQMNLYTFGTAVRPAEMMPLECFDNLQKGVLEIEEYFRISFLLAEQQPDIQQAFVKDYNSLLEKYNFTKSFEMIVNQ